jgi:hypothetical protein
VPAFNARHQLAPFFYPKCQHSALVN